MSSGASRIATTQFADRGSTTCECAAVAMKAHGGSFTPWSEHAALTYESTWEESRYEFGSPTEAKGDPEIPLTDAKLNDKFMLFSTPALGQIHADTLRNHVNTMRDDTDLSTSNSLIFSNGQQS